MKKAILLSFVVILGTAMALQAEFQVNTYTTDDQEFPAIAMGAQGDFVVVWRSAKQDEGSRGTYGQRFDADGTPIGGEFKINTTSVGGRGSTGPSVALDSSGNFVVAWTGYRDDEENIIARRYNAGGSPITGEFIVNTQTHSAYINSHIGPTVAMNASGAFVIVWQAWHGDSSGHGNWCVYGRAYNSNGVPQADEFMVTQLPHGYVPDVVIDDSGDFLVAWCRSGDSDDLPLGNYIRFRRYNADGTPKDDAVQITDDIGGDYNSKKPSIAMDGDGNFVIAWGAVFSKHDVYAQRFDPYGTPVSSSWLVNTYTDSYQGNASAAMHDSGELVIVWFSMNQDGSDMGIFGQRYNSDGTPVDEEFQLNTYTSGRQWHPDIALSQSGRFVVVWQDEDGQDGSGYGIFAEFGQLPRQLTYYVDDDATGANNGSSWADAYNDLQDALAVVLTGDEIHVAQGLYKPAGYITPPPPLLADGSSQEFAATPGDRTATFQLKNGVLIKGGYAGFGEPNADARDIKVYETVLSGDLAGNDVEVNDPCDLLTEHSRAENSYHVVTGSDCNESAVLDGFTITAGNANGEYYPLPQASGGGIQIRFGAMEEKGPVLTNCTFIRNSARWGGGVDNDHSSTTLTNCTFSENFADWGGGGIGNAGYQRLKLVNCTFTANRAGYNGGAVANGEGRSTLENCTLIANHAELGGAIYNGDAGAILTNCTLIGNSAEKGGAVYNKSDSSVRMTNCLVSENSCTEEGGVVYLRSEDSATLTNCILTANSAEKGGVLYVGNDGYAKLTNCTVTGNWATDNGGALYFDGPYDAKAIITNCILWSNTPQEIYPDLLGNEIVITYNDVQGGWPGEGNIDADPCFVQPECLNPISYWKFDEAGGTTAYDSVGQNHGTVYGASWTTGKINGSLSFDGMNDYVDMADTVKNYLDTSYTVSAWINTKTIHGIHYIAMYRRSTLDIGYQILFHLDHIDSDVRFIVGSLGNNAIASHPDAITTNTWYHVAGVREGNTLNVYVNGVSGIPDSETFGAISPDNFKIGAIHCCDQGIQRFFDGTIDDVMIFDTALSAQEIQQLYQNGLSGHGNYHLLQTSACINAADNNSLPADTQDLDSDGNTIETIPFDIEGNPRIIYDVVDMGAYEFQNTPPVGDAGPDQIVECARNTEEGTKVILDGTNSSDPDRGVLTYTWTGPFVESPVQGAAPIVTLEDGCPGEYVITLVVNDGLDDSEPNEVVIIVEDTTPPDFNLSVTPTILWPPNHEMVEITPSWTVSDECDPAPDVSLVSIVANEGDDIIGDGHTSDDIQIDDDGTIYVRAERSGPGIGRIYTITYQAVDDFGNVTVRSAVVAIPHELKFLARMGHRWLWRNHTGNLPEDLNDDGIVNLEDFAIFAENWIK